MDLNAFFSSYARDETDRPLTSPGGRIPAYVKLAPGDIGDGLHDVFFKDPRTFTPTPGPKGEIRDWGLYPYPTTTAPYYKDETNNVPEFDGISAMFRQMKYQTDYFKFPEGTPEKQFVQVLMDRKKEQLSQLDLKGLDKRDVIVKVYLAFLNDASGQPRVWRRIRVSAGIKLSAFQDKVLAPVMGWVRNLHSYTFNDFRDGSLYGPEGMRSVDMAHIAQVGYDYLPDDKYMLAHIFSKEGDKFGYLYDYGDKWYHVVQIERILSLDDSDGMVRVIDGRGMCPGENLHGCFQYADFMDDMDKASYAEKQKKKREILDAPNYKDFGKPPALFDPERFDVDAASQRLADALNSHNSVRTGAKQFSMPLQPSFVGREIDKKFLKKGQTITRDFQPENLGYWHEATSTTKDKRRETVCAACGKPGGNELKTCSGCRQIFYCSPEHQKAHWKSTHKDQCSKKYAKKS